MFYAMETTTLATAGLAGVLAGVFYFGGLWWTVRRMPCIRHPLNLYFGSVAVRLGVVLTVFYGVLISYDWPQLAASLVGFIFVRIVLICFLRSASSAGPPAQKAV